LKILVKVKVINVMVSKNMRKVKMNATGLGIATVLLHTLQMVIPNILVVNVNKYKFNYSKYNIIKLKI
jgi:hypothetical protein